VALTKVRRGGTDTGISDSSDATAITIDSSENITTTNAGTITAGRFINGTSGNDPWLKGVNSSGTETFFAKPDGTLHASGNVGIGTSSPSQKVHVEGAGNQFILLNNSSTNDGFYFKAGTGESAIQTNAGTNKLTFYTGGNERMSIDSAGAFRVPNVYSSTTGSGANINVASDGRMERSTSSRKYKNTITDATHGLADLLKLRSITYKGNNDGDTIFGGLIAEEVHDTGLTEFVQYDDDGKPDALSYGNMVALCIKAIQELSTKVETLEAKVTALESK